MTTLTSLPNELIFRICYNVHPDDIQSFSIVNRRVYLATTRNLGKHRALRQQYGVLNDQDSKPHTFQFMLNLFHNILSGSPVASYIRHVRCGDITDEIEYNPLTISDWKLEVIDKGWGCDLGLPRLAPICPLYAEEDDSITPRAEKNNGRALYEEYYNFWAALAPSSMPDPHFRCLPSLHLFYECLGENYQDLLYALLLSCLPNLETLDYRSTWGQFYLDQMVLRAASHLSKKQSQHTAFRSLRSVHITQQPLSLLAAFMGLPSITKVSGDEVTGYDFKRTREVSIHQYASIPVYSLPVSRATELNLSNSDVTSRDIKKLLQGGKPLKTFRSFTDGLDTNYINNIGWVLLANAQCSLEKLILYDTTQTHSPRNWGPVQLDKFEKLREVGIEFHYLARFTRDNKLLRMADFLPRSLEMLSLRTTGLTETLVLDLQDMLYRKKRRLPLLKKLHLCADFTASEEARLKEACSDKDVTLVLES